MLGTLRKMLYFEYVIIIAAKVYIIRKVKLWLIFQIPQYSESRGSPM